MIQIGDLVQSQLSDRIGIVIRRIQNDPTYVYVLYHDATCSIHTSKLKKLEKKMSIGDLVRSINTGEIGIVVGMDNSAKHDYWFVMMHDKTYSIHKRRLTKLETK